MVRHSEDERCTYHMQIRISFGAIEQQGSHTLTNCTTVLNFNSPLDIAIASGVGSILVPLNLAISFNNCRQLGACICSGGDFPNGSVMMLGIAPCSGARMLVIAGAVKPSARVSKRVRG